jgi:hypothetical protein
VKNQSADIVPQNPRGALSLEKERNPRSLHARLKHPLLAHQKIRQRAQRTRAVRSFRSPPNQGLTLDYTPGCSF